MLFRTAIFLLKLALLFLFSRVAKNFTGLPVLLFSSQKNFLFSPYSTPIVFFTNFLQLNNGGIRVTTQVLLASSQERPQVLSRFSAFVPLDEYLKDLARTFWDACLLGNPSLFDADDPVESLLLEINPEFAKDFDDSGNSPDFPTEGWRSVAFAGSTSAE